MVPKVKTVAFIGMRPIEITVEAQILPGIASFAIVGLPDKAVAEAKERIRSTFHQIGLGFPAKRVVINMAPADIPKVGSHYDLPIALALLAAMEIIENEMLDNTVAIGELGLDGSLCHVSGGICAAMLANDLGRSLICPKSCEKEAVWSGNDGLIAAPDVISLINHLTGKSQLPPVEQAQKSAADVGYAVDMADVCGQPLAKRALEIAATGGHNVLMIGPPGSGKSMLAARMRTILPFLSANEALETTCIYSLAGMLLTDDLVLTPPFREPHHTASLISLVGGGSDAKPGELSLAHNGILFMDEFPEFQRQVIDALRQPLETNSITISRAKEHITYPANIQLVAAMNHCKCGFFEDKRRRCARAPRCAAEYIGKISGPILDRFDVVIYVNSISATELFKDEARDCSRVIRERVTRTREIQTKRADALGNAGLKLNGKIQVQHLEEITKVDADVRAFFQKIVEHSNMSARGCHKLLRVARTIADMDELETVQRHHIAEAAQYRMI